jgi:hypothetical protein
MELNISESEFNYLIVQLEGKLIEYDLQGKEGDVKKLSEILDKIRKRNPIIRKLHKMYKKEYKSQMQEK